MAGRVVRRRARAARASRSCAMRRRGSPRCSASYGPVALSPRACGTGRAWTCSPPSAARSRRSIRAEPGSEQLTNYRTRGEIEGLFGSDVEIELLEVEAGYTGIDEFWDATRGRRGPRGCLGRLAGRRPTCAGARGDLAPDRRPRRSVHASSAARGPRKLRARKNARAVGAGADERDVDAELALDELDVASRGHG